MKSIISRTNNNEAQWSVDVFLSKSERQQLLMYLSMDTAKALTVFQGENEVQLAQDVQKDSAEFSRCIRTRIYMSVIR